MNLEEGQYLKHYGILRRSGRYPWGSGKDPLQRSKTFLDIIKGYEKQGISQADIAKMFAEPGYPFTVADLRAVKSRSVHIQTEDRIRTAQTYREKGMSPSEIGRRMDLNESTVRSLLEPGRLDKLNQLHQTANVLRKEVDEKGFVDIGAHVERDLPGLNPDNPETRMGISRDKLQTAVSMLKEEGYVVGTYSGLQQGTGDRTTYKVLAKPMPGLPKKDPERQKEINRQIFANKDKVELIGHTSEDGGRTYRDAAFQKPLNIDPKRVGVRYKEEGGADADGVIYVRPGVKDIELGKSHYAQVRIAIGGTHYLKGMAIYKNDLPPGVDLLFNTNKSNTGNKLDALKKLQKVPLKDENGKIVKDSKGKAVDSKEVDWQNPFGSFPKLVGGQIVDKNNKVTSGMNILNEAGDWNTWSRNLSTQVLAKQKPELAKSQLDLTHDRKRQEFAEIKALQNPLIKRKLLETFSDEVDSSAVHMKAAALPRQATRVLLPVPGLKPTEVFAPSFKDGERVALVRFPHSGKHEIPELTVNNRNREARELLSQGKKIMAPDAIGIHPKVAEHLSGADFDGDTVIVIPNKHGLIQKDPALEGLKGFDPQKYKVKSKDEDPVNGRDTMDDKQKGNQMGRVTNLITDMTLRGASSEDLAKAVRHSMVVIDAQKHNLDWKASEKDHGILALKRRYQGVNEKGQVKGASTLMSRASSEARPFKRKDAKAGPGVTRTSVGTIDNKTGHKVYELTGERDPKGNLRTFRSRKLAETDDAFTLVSDHGGTEIEKIYATHSNRLKALANEVRKEIVKTETVRKQPSAAKVYAAEAASLKAKLNDALKNAPLERRAQALAGTMVAQRKRANPDMDASEKKKIQGQVLEQARARVGAKKIPVDITDREWEAIQAGAVSKETLTRILNNTDVDKLRDRATPKGKPVMTTVMSNRAKAMLNSGATYAEISEALGIAESTLQSSLTDGG